MLYCHKCGELNKDGDSFCGSCGVKIKEDGASDNKSKKSKKGLIILIIVILIMGYVLLDFWAVSKLNPVFNVENLLSSVSNFEASAGYTSASASTTITIENPTFVPVIMSRLVYDVGYGDTKVVEGKSGMILIAPYSTQDLPVDAKVSYVNAGIAGFKGLKNLIFGGNDKINANMYVDFFITKIKIYEWRPMI